MIQSQVLAQAERMSVILETTLGDIIIDLYTDERKRCKYTDWNHTGNYLKT